MRVVVKNLPKSATEEQIEKEFNKHGEITDLFLLKKNEKSRRVCFIGYKIRESAIEAVRYRNKSMFMNAKISCEEARNITFQDKKNALYSLIGKDVQNKTETIDSKKITIRNIPYCATEEEVKKHLSVYGRITRFEMEIVENKNKGCAIIEYESLESAIEAQKECKIFMGRRIEMEEYKSKKGGVSSAYYNSLFFDFSSVVNRVCEEEGVSKEDLVDLKDKELGVRISLLETHLVEQTKKFLEVNKIYLTKLNGKRCKTTLLIRNYDLLNTLDVIGTKAKIKVAPSKCLAIVEYDKEEHALDAYRKLNLKRVNDKAIYCEFLPLSDTEEKKAEEERATDEKYSTKLIIKNVPFQATKSEIKKLIESQVKVCGIRMPLKRDGSSRGVLFRGSRKSEECRANM
jgi:multiple RNA-binding domain-containing protein 1